MRPCLCVALALSAVAVASGLGCGGGSGDPSGFQVKADTTMTTATALTKASFVARINDTCRRRWPRLLANFAGFVKKPTKGLEHGHRYTNAVRYTFVAGLDFHIFDEIHDLGAPPGEERRLSELLGAMQEPVETTQQGLAPIRTPAQLEAHFTEYNSLARAYGLSDCLVAGAHLPPSFDPLPDG